MRNHLSSLLHINLPFLGRLNQIALSARKHEAPINNRGSEEPLCDEEPPDSNNAPSCDPTHSARGEVDRPRSPEEGVREEEERVREGYPEPALLDEELVDEVAFLGEVGGRGGLGVRMCECVVGGGAGGGVDEREEGAD